MNAALAVLVVNRDGENHPYPLATLRYKTGASYLALFAHASEGAIFLGGSDVTFYPAEIRLLVVMTGAGWRRLCL